ncbi:type II secretion system protein [Ferrigenium sp. UT5]|uniref:type II secretion system protein n=1 Tax=Ferrigenium sp. UT5 TaxID=3242105 RepID=UPI00354EAAC1
MKLANTLIPENRVFGFTLVEMAMVLTIVALLLTGLVPTISSQLEQRKISETKSKLIDIQQALIGFALINGRLPCPSQSSLATGTADAGIEATIANTCACVTAGGGVASADASRVACTATSVTGVLPWATLGISETDAWNRRFTYRVTKRFADEIAAGTTDCTPAVTAPAASSFALCSKGVPDILSAGSTPVAAAVPAVFVSHGMNGAGAFISNGIQLTVSSNSDEVENSDNDKNFVSHEFTPGYDDLLGWIPSSILFSKMVSAGKLP